MALLALRSCRLVCLTLLLATSSGAAWEPDGVDLTRPRILFRAEDLPAIQAKIARDPFPAVLAAMAARTALADPVALDDDGITAHRFKARAAKNLAFLYAVDRTLVVGEVVPFPSPAEREAVGDRVRDLLLNLFPECRLLVPEPIGGWDRDISTSEELLQYATAYDTLLGAGYDFGPDQAEIVRRLQALAGSTLRSYLEGFAALHQNNHRSKTGASLVVAGVVLAEESSDPATDPEGYEEPSRWIEYGLQQVDLIIRWALVAGDGVYGEGPFYQRFASQNLLPFARAWDRLLGGAAYDAGGILVPSFWRHPTFLRGQRWQLDMTLPDGSLVPQDDGNPGRSHYFGATPPGPHSAAWAWRWANAPTPYETDGNVDMGADSIVVHDPDVAPAPPSGSPTSFYHEGGNAIFRSDWGPDAVMAVVQAESGAASEFGTDRDGLPVAPESHEHAEPGAFLLHAYGERLALDPGYFSFGQRNEVNAPEHHNTILVDGRGPVTYLGASLWWRDHPDLPAPPADGEASLVDTLDSGFLDASRVLTRYGTGTLEDPYPDAPLIERRFLFADDAYLAVADRVESTGTAHSFTWLLHGNGGGTSEGSFEATPAGGRWTRSAARLDAAYAFDTGAPATATNDNVHEEPGGVERTHTTLETTVTAVLAHAAQLVYPSPTAGTAPTAVALDLPGVAAVRLEDAAADRRVLFLHRAPKSGTLELGPAETGGAAIATDADLALFDSRLDGSLRLAFAEAARRIDWNGATLVKTRRRGGLGVALEAAAAEIVAETRDRKVVVSGLGFTPLAADGACAFKTRGDDVVIKLRGERRIALRAAAGNSAPGASAGRSRRVKVGRSVRLNGKKSCDADGDALTPRWELVSAPPGSDWLFEGADEWRPTLHVDRPGPYRVELVVTDSSGAASRPVQVLILGGKKCEGGFDEDRDGMLDGADPDCDKKSSR